MAKRTYRGSCHCKRVTFEADIDLDQGTNKCNCTSCWKRRWWTVSVKPGDFRSISGESELSMFSSRDQSLGGGFCRHCGVIPYVFIPAAEWNDGEYVSINVAALDDLDPADLIAAPIRYMDGRRDNWWEVPAETRHL